MGEPSAGWRRTVLINGCEVHALEDAADDDDGCDGLRTLWPAALACSRLLGPRRRCPRQSHPKPARGAACPPSRHPGRVVSSSDGDAVTMAQLGENLLANGQTRISARCLTGEPLPADLIGDLILACDCTYNASLHAPLLQTLVALFARQRHAKALIASTRRPRRTPRARWPSFSLCGERPRHRRDPDGAWRRRSP